ncbi:LTA synthase family protein [Paenibacillus contaminans]|uniref:LTA synthase family protein n=1 Tax=Paenibacillus contaminans TaxID=450362 RepID=A0A329MQR1_9BACL|nr:LTA synthase family protein [Paenibacillus contaminans]RAV21850.1 LTA synthase family protein [Paenibacillus contaminans]
MLSRKAIQGRLSALLSNSRPRTYLAAFGILSAAAFALAVGVEFIQRGSFTNVFNWASANPSSFYLNVILDFFILLLIYCLLGSLMISVSVASLLLLVASLVSYYKIKLIGEPFMPWDILLKKEGMNIIPLVAQTSAYMRLGAVVLVSLACLAARLILPKLSLPLSHRALIGLFACFMLFSLSYKPALTGNLQARMGIQDINWNQSQNYELNGVTLAFAMNVKNAIVPKPEGYSQTRMEEIAADLIAKPEVEALAAVTSYPSGEKPNVIFVMNESFWDPTLLPGVTFSEDPLPTVHALQKTATAGYMLSPQFGGGTSNVEFEVLTGNSMSNLPSGSMPYQQYISRPTPSLAGFFGTQGYKSMAIHSYEGWFWNRNTVYKQLGFQSFMSKEFFTSPEYKGGFIADDEVSRAIISQVQQSEQPMFIYAVTMQNHGPYETWRYSGKPIKVEGNLTDAARDELETYVQGARDADASLKMLIDHYSASEEPTMIVFYGDHLPMLGYDYDVYRQAGFVSSGNSAEWSLEETKKMHSTPLVVWSNFGQEKKNVPLISSSFLGSYVLNELKMEMPPIFAFDYQLYGKLPGLLKGLVVDADQQLSASPPDSLLQDLQHYQELQYDTLFGKQYVQQLTGLDLIAAYPLSDFNSEFTDVRIETVEMYEADSEQLVLKIKGKNFFDGVYAIVNGVQLAPSNISSDTLEIQVPLELTNKKSSLTFQVRQINTKNIPLSESNVLEIPLDELTGPSSEERY